MANTTFTGPVRSENGFQSITESATGAVTTNASYGKTITGGVHALSGAGAVDIINLVTEVTSTGADALTLADGTAGQVKIITMVVDGGDATLTPTTFANGSTMTFADVHDTVMIVYANTIGWVIVSNSGVVVA